VKTEIVTTATSALTSLFILLQGILFMAQGPGLVVGRSLKTNLHILVSVQKTEPQIEAGIEIHSNCRQHAVYS
jgi:hypothetical protein